MIAGPQVVSITCPLSASRISEAIQTTGPTGGPRSPGAPIVNAGPDRSASVGVPIQLQGHASFTNTIPTIIQWNRYSGSTNGTFANASQTNSTVTFSAPGVYTLMLSVSNGVHAVAYDAVVITVSPVITMAITRVGSNVQLDGTGAAHRRLSSNAQPRSPRQAGTLRSQLRSKRKLPDHTRNSFSSKGN